jgi:hypothetical protein
MWFGCPLAGFSATIHVAWSGGTPPVTTVELITSTSAFMTGTGEKELLQELAKCREAATAAAVESAALHDVKREIGGVGVREIQGTRIECESFPSGIETATIYRPARG